ncbi:MAG: HEAT repeat domain-containing protein [Chloroflexota bacterium]|nr:HEAT repeat domain-containing protein [Chloroflexota bacterium]
MPLFKPNIAAMKEKRDLTGLLMVLKGKDARARAEAARALGELGARSTVSAIAELLLTIDNKLAEKISAAEALGIIKDDAAIDALVNASANSRERERAAIDAAIDSPDRKYSINLYINRIAADEYTLRSAIAIALGRIGGERAIRALFDLLASETGRMESSVKSDVKTSINDALQRGGDTFVPLACEELKHSSIEVRQWAAHCLGDLGGDQAIHALIAAAYDEAEEFDVRETALRSLGGMGDRRAIPYLEDLLQSGNRAVVRDAQAALIGIRQRFPLPPDEK